MRSLDLSDDTAQMVERLVLRLRHHFGEQITADGVVREAVFQHSMQFKHLK